MVVLAIGAHPDDIEFGCYAVLAKLAKKTKIFFTVFSAGELSGSKSQRIKEAKKSASLIDAEINILDYLDGIIPVNPKIIDELRTHIERIRPDTIFTLYPNDAHQDHRSVAQITVSANRIANRLLLYEVPSTQADFSPNFFCDVTDYFDLKEKALNCHRTQKNKSYLNILEVRGLAHYRAYQCGRNGRLFEAFYLYRGIE